MEEVEEEDTFFVCGFLGLGLGDISEIRTYWFLVGNLGMYVVYFRLYRDCIHLFPTKNQSEWYPAMAKWGNGFLGLGREALPTRQDCVCTK